MFRNIGKTIKVMSQVLLCCSIVLSVLAYFRALNLAIESQQAGVLVSAGIEVIIWIVLSGVGSLLMYGFGQLIENTQAIYFRLEGLDEKLQSTNKKEG